MLNQETLPINYVNSSTYMLPTLHSFKGELNLYLGRVENNVGRIVKLSFEDIHKHASLKDLEKEILASGEQGCFDDNGVVPVSIVNNGNDIYLYYVGFQLGVKVPYYMFLGLAISENGGKSFGRYSQVPILDRNDGELYARCGAFVEKFHDLWHIWYIGSIGNGWTENQDAKKLPLYSMRHGISKDGINWSIDNKLCFDFESEDEHGFGRPCVIYKDSIYKMFFCIRTYSSGYKLAYAESQDLKQWYRKEHMLIEYINSQTKKDFDDQEKCYPNLIKLDKDYLFFYGANSCGKAGFAYLQVPEEFI
ncbi:MAG: hypothetical protein MK033_09750 [Candidatus Caenarcaniphilales bacterium]|nr:hypothetical protein [Candidatus Caenarcaniphilales bacterium]